MGFSEYHSHAITILKLRSFDSSEEYDLRLVFSEVSLHYDIDNIVSSGYITIEEQGNLFMDIPIVGRETLEIQFETFTENNQNSNPGNIYHRVFFVYAIDSLEEFGDTRRYCIRFTDALGMANNDIRLSMKYEGKVEDIIEEVVDKVINKKDIYKTEIVKSLGSAYDVVNLEKEVETKYDVDFVVPSWKPLKFFAYITGWGITNKVSSSYEFNDCVFYQDTDGKYKFTSYAEMFSRGGVKTFKRSPSNTNNAETDYSIVNFTFSDVFNTQIGKASTLLGHSVHTLDWATKEYYKSEFPYSSIFKAVEDYNNSDSIPMTDNEYSCPEESTYGVESTVNFNLKEVPNDLIREKRVVPVSVKGVSVNTHLRSLRITIELNGSSDLKLGIPVMLDFGTHDNIDVSLNYLNTKWVISKIRHVFSLQECKTYVEAFTPVLNKSKG